MMEKARQAEAYRTRDYEAVRNGGAGLIDLSNRARITAGGSEAVMFLNGLITNDMKTLAEKTWMPAVFPNVQGRLIAAVRVIRLVDQSDGKPRFLIDTEVATHSHVLKTIERFTMAGDFKVADITKETAMLSVQGRDAARAVRSMFGDGAATLPKNGLEEVRWQDVECTVIRASHTSEDGFDVLISADKKSALANAFIEAGAISVAEETFETLRVEAGVGHFGKDMDESNVVTEANLDDAVSFTKGCYIGQEIIARIKYRGHVAKKLTGITFEHSERVEPGTVVRSTDGKEIGRITSFAFSPRLERAIALGFVRYEQLVPGTEVNVGASEVKAVVTELPFVRGSWYEGN
jgi:folate-binding protein YgfZ